MASGYISGLTFTDPGASAQLVMGITTGSPGSSSVLTVSKYNSSADAGRYVAQRDCVTMNSLSIGGQHYESDYNYNTTTGTYMGFGKDYDAPNKKFRAAPQSSPWINEELCPVAGGACLTTFTIPPGDALVWESYEHWDAGCSFSSVTACAYYDAVGLQLYSGGSPVGSIAYYNVRNASTHGVISFIPINKTAWTHPQYAIQHQWDINASSSTLTATIPYSTAVAYYTTSGTATICYTTDGSTPTGNGAGTCTHGTTYTGPITVSSSETVKAIATQAAFTDSTVGSAAYVIGGTATWTQTVVGTGTVTGINSSSNTYALGTNIGPLTATPGTGYSFTGLSSTSGDFTASGTTNPVPFFTLTQNSAATWTFTINSWTLSTVTTGSGTGTITGCAGTVNYNVGYSCTVTPTGGSTLTSVTGCGGSGTTTYTGNMPNNNCTVTATFTAAAPTTSVSISGTVKFSGTVGVQ